MTFEELKKEYLEGSAKLKAYERKLSELSASFLDKQEALEDEDFDYNVDWEDERDHLEEDINVILQVMTVAYKAYRRAILSCWDTMPESERILATKAYPPGSGVRKNITYSSNGLMKFLYSLSMKASRNTLDLSILF